MKKDTIGFSRVVLQVWPNKSSSKVPEIPPTLVAWCFNFDLNGGVKEAEAETPRD